MRLTYGWLLLYHAVSPSGGHPRYCMGAAVLATLSDRRACSTVIGLALTFSPLAGVFGFARLGWSFVPIVAAIVVGYALLVESMKAFFYRRALGIGSSSR